MGRAPSTSCTSTWRGRNAESVLANSPSPSRHALVVLHISDFANRPFRPVGDSVGDRHGGSPPFCGRRPTGPGVHAGFLGMRDASVEPTTWRETGGLPRPTQPEACSARRPHRTRPSLAPCGLGKAPVCGGILGSTARPLISGTWGRVTGGQPPAYSPAAKNDRERSCRGIADTWMAREHLESTQEDTIPDTPHDSTTIADTLIL
jgi:hypothetical protein